MKPSSAQGQILVLVLLVVLVGLTIGLSIASRTLTNIKNAGELDQSNRAFSAAEAGIEKALANINASGNCDAGACDPNVPGITTNVSIVTAGSNSNAFGLQAVDKDSVIQVNLAGYTGANFTIYWGTRNDEAEQVNSAAVVTSVIYTNGGVYGLGKATADYWAGSRANNFTPALLSTAADSLTLQDGSVQNNYAFKTTITLTGGSAPLTPNNSTYVIARVRLLYADKKQIAIAPQAGFTLPTQGKQITSTASAGGKTRTVKVFKSEATLPAIFDYALFNGSTSALTK